MDELIIAGLGVSTVVLTLLGEEIQDEIGRVLGDIKEWAAEDGRATATAISTSALLVAGLVVVAVGVFTLLRTYLPYILPETPREIPLSMTVLSSALGLCLHQVNGKERGVVLGLALLFVASFGVIAFIPTYEMMDGAAGYQPYAAASIVWLCSASEMMVAYVAFSTAGNAIGYLWLVPTGGVLIPIYVVAWLLSGLKLKIIKLLRWMFTGRKEIPSSVMGVITASRDVVDTVDQERDETVRRGFLLTYQWTRFWQWFTSFFSGLSNARRSTRTASESLSERCQEVKRQVKGKCKELVTVLVLVSGLSTADASERSIVVLVDGTGSYPYTEEAKEHVVNQVIPNLGPGDSFWLGMLGNFDKQLPSVTAKVPPIDGVMLDGWKSLFEWQKSRKKLGELLSDVDSQKKQLTAQVEQAVQRQKGGVTRLYTWLSYTSALLTSAADERWLLIYSDMHQENGKVSTRMPPDYASEFTRVNVRVLHVPFESNWLDVKKSWEEWFRDSGAQSFEMYPVGTSLTLDSALPASHVPRQMPRFSAR